MLAKPQFVVAGNGGRQVNVLAKPQFMLHVLLVVSLS